VEEQGRRPFSSEWAARLLLSLILGVVLWGWVTVTGDPERSKEFPNIPVAARGLRDGLIVLGDLPMAEVRVTGPRSAIQDLVSTDMQANVDLTSIEQAGTYSVRIQVPKPDDTWSTSASPRSIDVVVEAQETKVFPLTPTISGNLGSNQEVGEIATSTSEVTVSGPASLLATVARVDLPVDIANRTTDFASSFTPVPVTADGQPVANLTVNPSPVSATVEITARGKRVAVIVQLDGDPAPGFEVVDRLVNPDTVLVDGPAELLEGLITVNADVVDISGAQSDITQRVSIVGLPEDVTLLEPQQGQVDVVVQIRQRGVQQPLPSQQVSVINLDPGLVAELSPDEVQVTVIGNEDELDQLTPDQLRVLVDAAGLGPGTYQLRPTVVLPPNMEWTAVDPAMVSVTISEEQASAAGATPRATPEP
jgi:YbbR domain-containing protein